MVTRAGGYRADIDGLRAIAVVPVVLFHLGVPGFSGGYVGVDVFFVISGFLITGLLRSRIAKRQLRLREFYAARVRRLAPALLAVTVPTTAAAMIVLFPEDMRSFAASLAAQVVSLQNVVFLVEGEYFRGAETKFLLHTWSLAVEEQFYLVWPLLLLLLGRTSRARTCAALGFLALASFSLNVAVMTVSPKASFFLLPSRAWELATGGIVAVLCDGASGGGGPSLGKRSVASAVGLLLIVGSVATFSPTTPFPGWRALLPVAGTSLVVAAGATGPVGVGRWLEHRICVRLGLISYPLYLWHWPLIVLAVHLHLEPRTLFHSVALGGIALVAAELTHRFVEVPIRRGDMLRTPAKLVAAAAASAGSLLVFGCHTYASDGAAYRFSAQSRPFLTASFSSSSDRCGIVFRALHPSAAVCSLHNGSRGRRILLWGNSHADMWSSLFVRLAEENDVSVYLNARNCRPLPDSNFCSGELQAAIEHFIKDERITDVVLASTWFDEYGVRDEVLEDELERLVTRLSGSGARTWLVSDTPRGSELDPLVAYRRHPLSPVPGTVSVDEYRAQRRRELTLFARLAAHREVAVVDPSRYLCGERFCTGGRDQNPWYRDTNHLTDAGARETRPAFVPVFVGASESLP